MKAMADCVTEQVADARFQYEIGTVVLATRELDNILTRRPAVFTDTMLFSMAMDIGIRIGENRHNSANG